MSLDRVPGPAELYIGGLISMRRHEALKKANITHVVTVLRQPLEPVTFEKYQHLVIELDDMEDEDLLQYFPTANSFIRAGLRLGGGILVHCMMGKSRSAAVVIAWMLSQDSSLTPDSALESLRGIRSVVEPNAGFMQQLRLYHDMGCPEDVTSQPKYQRWLYQQEVEMSVACGRAPDTIRFEDEAAPSQEENQSLEVRCRKCRRTLATNQYLVLHTPKPPSATQTVQTGPIGTLGPSATPQCAHIFLDPLSWMRAELEEGRLEGRLTCPNPKCRSVIGKYAWQGMRCSCGEWVTPAITLARARVDEIRRGASNASPKRQGKM